MEKLLVRGKYGTPAAPAAAEEDAEVDREKVKPMKDFPPPLGDLGPAATGDTPSSPSSSHMSIDGSISRESEAPEDRLCVAAEVEPVVNRLCREGHAHGGR